MKNKYIRHSICVTLLFMCSQLLVFPQEKPIAVISVNNKNASKKVETSILAQNYNNFSFFEISPQENPQEKNCTDSTLLGQLWSLIHTLENETIVVILSDGECFSTKDALSSINKQYQTSTTWMTSSYKSFYAWLFKQIKLQDFMIKNRFADGFSDDWFLRPMMHMAGDHLRTIDSERAQLSDEASNVLEGQITHQPVYIPLADQPSTIHKKKEVDLVIFSLDRPLQLYALLESIERYMKGVATTTVICRSSSKTYASGYKKVQKRFPNVSFVKQLSKSDFREKTLAAALDTPSEYVMFAVDDIIVKDHVGLSECIRLLEKTFAHGFYLRLGLNLDYCFNNDRHQPLPDLLKIESNVYVWRFKGSHDDWSWAKTLDMALYQKAEIKDLLYHIPFDSPNSLEGTWANAGHPDAEKLGICYAQSKIVNIPLNLVQRTCFTRHLNYSAASLLDIFKQGFKFDIDPLYKVENKSVHMEYKPTFILRS